jgi:hypothetical protein
VPLPLPPLRLALHLPGTFDAHYDGAGETLRPCTFPDGIEFVETAGCAIVQSAPRSGVTVYRVVREGKYGAAGRQPARGKATDPRIEVAIG